MALPEIPECDVTFRNNNIEVLPAAYDPGDTVQIEIAFTQDGDPFETDNITVKLVLLDGTVEDLSSTIVEEGTVDGEYSLDYYLSTGADGDDDLIPAGVYRLRVQGMVDDTNVSTSTFFIVNANEAVSPEADNSSDFTASCMLEVGRLLRARTKDHLGNRLGIFTPDTSVSEIDARENVGIARHYVEMYVGYDFSDTTIFTDEILAIIVSVVSLKAACLIELGFFPEQVRTDKSAYKEYNEMFDKLLEQLVDALDDMASDGEIGPGDTDSGGPAYSYPEDDGGLVGWQSEW